MIYFKIKTLSLSLSQIKILSVNCCMLPTVDGSLASLRRSPLCLPAVDRFPASSLPLLPLRRRLPSLPATAASSSDAPLRRCLPPPKASPPKPDTSRLRLQGLRRQLLGFRRILAVSALAPWVSAKTGVKDLLRYLDQGFVRRLGF